MKSLSVRKVGESCDTSYGGGVCGAPNSFCVDGRCVCATNFVPIFGNEYCVQHSQMRTTGESCSPSVGTCNVNTGTTCRGSTGFNYMKDEIQNSPRSCACNINERIYLPNHVSMNDFIGKKVPICGPGKISHLNILATNKQFIYTCNFVNMHL